MQADDELMPGAGNTYPAWRRARPLEKRCREATATFVAPVARRKPIAALRHRGHDLGAAALADSAGMERWRGSLKRELVRPAAVSSFDEARRRISSYVDHYNNARLHGALGYVTPADKLIGLEKEIFAERDRKLEEARERRATARCSSRGVA